jgi:hypothetical protein
MTQHVIEAPLVRGVHPIVMAERSGRNKKPASAFKASRARLSDDGV